MNAPVQEHMLRASLPCAAFWVTSCDELNELAPLELLHGTRFPGHVAPLHTSQERLLNLPFADRYQRVLDLLEPTDADKWKERALRAENGLRGLRADLKTFQGLAKHVIDAIDGPRTVSAFLKYAEAANDAFKVLRHIIGHEPISADAPALPAKKPMPADLRERYDPDATYIAGSVDGWNECLDAITDEQPAPEWDGEGLPPIGAEVLIRHGRDDDDHRCVVTGYYVWKSLDGNPSVHRVFVNVVYKGTKTPNARMLCDLRPAPKEAN
ncbi:MAG TPA: hypothetical protein VF534_01745 [Paraburkholderia sp.]